jgi:hypothetical protein
MGSGSTGVSAHAISGGIFEDWNKSIQTFKHSNIQTFKDSKIQRFDDRSLEFGVWSLEFGVWSLEFGV